jgi:hypothetical protein
MGIEENMIDIWEKSLSVYKVTGLYYCFKKDKRTVDVYDRQCNIVRSFMYNREILGFIALENKLYCWCRQKFYIYDKNFKFLNSWNLLNNYKIFVSVYNEKIYIMLYRGYECTDTCWILIYNQVGELESLHNLKEFSSSSIFINASIYVDDNYIYIILHYNYHHHKAANLFLYIYNKNLKICNQIVYSKNDSFKEKINIIVDMYRIYIFSNDECAIVK